MIRTTLCSVALLVGLTLLVAVPSQPLRAEDRSPLVVAHEMVNAWNARDVDAIAELFAEDGRFYSMGAPSTLRDGRETIREVWGELLAGVSEIELQLRNIAVSGNAVFLERVDVFTYKGREGRVPVACVLEIRDGKVQEWREYYDHASLLREMGVAGSDS